MTTIGYRLKKGCTRVQVAVQELEDDVVLAGSSDVYETAEPSVILALDSNAAVERVPAKKGGESE